MSELEEKLESILGNPQAMAQIMSLAQSLNGSGSAASGGDGAQAQPQEPTSDGASPPAPPVTAAAQPPASAGSSAGGLGSLLGGLDPNMLSAAASLLGQFNGSGDDDRRVALLTALRPFVREQRYARLDKAIHIARLSRLIRSGLDLFRARKGGSQGEDSHREGDGHV